MELVDPLVNEVNLVITNKIIKDIKQDIGCGCPKHLRDADEAVDWILFPVTPPPGYKQEIFRRLR